MPTLISQLGTVFLSAIQESLLVRVLLTFGILILGVLAARIASRTVQMIWERRLREEEMVEKVKGRERAPDRLIQYLIILVTLVLALIPINASVAKQLAQQIAAYIPQVITAVLIFLLGVILVNGLIRLLREVMDNLDLRQYANTLGVSPRILDAFMISIKLLLYLVILEIAIIQLGVSPQIVQNTLAAASYGIVALLVLLGFFGFKDLIQNYAAGIYLRGSEVLEPGKRIRLGEESGEVRDISLFSTTVSTNSGYFLLSPNKELMNREILFKRVQAEIETLEDIKNYFVGTSTDQHGQASAEMALTIFGFDTTQGDISEETTDNPEPQELQEAIETLTNGEVKTAFVEEEKITDVADEFKIWFNNGALIIPYFDKDILFPGAEDDHYVLAAGVEGEEILLVDPSTSGGSGGVYYVEKPELHRAIAGKEGGGYIVISPRGTTAFWRIKNDLIYSSISLYQQLSKSLEVQLSKILRSGRVLKYITPEAVEDFTEKWREDGEPVTQMWTPENGGEKKLDEFTDDS